MPSVYYLRSFWICALRWAARACAEWAVPADLASDGPGRLGAFFIRGVTVIESMISRVLWFEEERTPRSRSAGLDPENHVS